MREQGNIKSLSGELLNAKQSCWETEASRKWVVQSLSAQRKMTSMLFCSRRYQRGMNAFR
ncbi:hypothetical protein FKM82_006718 [Ascaphus truei]